MSQTRVQFLECVGGKQAVIVVHTTVRGGVVAHLVDTFSRIRIEVHKVESRLEDDGWVQRLVVAAPGGNKLDQTQLDDLRAAVFSTIQQVSLDSDDDSASGTFAVRSSSPRDIEETG